MGTNYYHRTEVCEKCGRYDDRHIGKSSGGWLFNFRGYPPDEWQPSRPVIKSYQDWLAILESGGEIYDEYNRKVTLDEFKRVVAERGDDPLNHFYECNDGWLDHDGHPFSDTEFS